MLLLINELWSQIFITLSLRLKLIIIICGPVLARYICSMLFLIHAIDIFLSIPNHVHRDIDLVVYMAIAFI